MDEKIKGEDKINVHYELGLLSVLVGYVMLKNGHEWWKVIVIVVVMSAALYTIVYCLELIWDFFAKKILKK